MDRNALRFQDRTTGKDAITGQVERAATLLKSATVRAKRSRAVLLGLAGIGAILECKGKEANMFLRAVATLLVLSSNAALAQGQICTGPGFGNAMAQIESHFRAEPIALMNAQLQINAVARRTMLQPDGEWGPATASEVCTALQTYATINDGQADNFVRSQADAAEFATWMGAMARVNLNPGLLEAPD